MSETPTYPYSPGLEGVPAGVTTISEIDSDRSSLQYRGYDVHDLASQGSFEETAYLLLHKKLPDAAELGAFKSRLAEMRILPDAVSVALSAMPKESHPMDLVRTAYAVAAPFDPDYAEPATNHEANVRKAERIVAIGTTAVGVAYRIKNGLPALTHKPEHSAAQNFLYHITGEEPQAKATQVMDVLMTMYAEHSFNASTFADRVCVSTLSDLYSGTIVGISTLRGPLHGGANEQAMRMLLAIGTPDNAQAWIDDALTNKKLIMGFGHREYKKGDSRAIYLTQVAKELSEELGDTTWKAIADVLEKTILEKKGLYPNVDFPAAYALYLLKIPMEIYTPIFVMARVAGYAAHAMEQLAGNRLIRPKAVYEGERNLDYVPISDR